MIAVFLFQQKTPDMEVRPENDIVPRLPNGMCQEFWQNLNQWSVFDEVLDNGFINKVRS